MIHMNHSMYAPCLHFPPVLHTQTFVSQDLKELAVKQVQFKHVNTGSFFFLDVEMNRMVWSKNI